MHFSHICHFRPFLPNQPTKNTNFRPIPDPTQPNPRVNPTHGQLCAGARSFTDRVPFRLANQQRQSTGDGGPWKQWSGSGKRLVFKDLRRQVARWSWCCWLRTVASSCATRRPLYSSHHNVTLSYDQQQPWFVIVGNRAGLKLWRALGRYPIPAGPICIHGGGNGRFFAFKSFIIVAMTLS